MKHPFIVAVKCTPDINPDLLVTNHFSEWMEKFPTCKGKTLSGLGEWGFAYRSGFGIFTLLVEVPDLDVPHAEVLLLGLSVFELSQIKAGYVMAIPQINDLLNALANPCGNVVCHHLVEPYHVVVVLENVAKTFMFNYQAVFDFQKGVRPDTVH